MKPNAIRQRALEALRKRYPEEYRDLHFREWARACAPVIVTTEDELRVALQSPEPFYMEAR